MYQKLATDIQQTTFAELGYQPSDVRAGHYHKDGVALIPKTDPNIPIMAATYMIREGAEAMVESIKRAGPQAIQELVRNFDDILGRLLKPIIFYNPSIVDEEELRTAIRHEELHLKDFRSSGGKECIAIELCGCHKIDPFLSINLAFKTWMELRAYTLDNHPGVAPAVRELSGDLELFRSSPNFDEWLLDVSTALVRELYRTGITKVDGTSVTEQQLNDAGVWLAALIRTQGLLTEVGTLEGMSFLSGFRGD